MGISEIVNKFIDVWASKQELYVKVGKATDINKETFTFTFQPIDESSTVEDVRMKTIADSGDETFTLVPKEGSFVVVDFHSYTTAQCIAVQQSDEVLINSVQTIFNNGENGGIVKIQELTDKLNALVDEFNSFVQIFNSHTHAGVQTGGGITAPSTQQAQDATDFNKSDYENETITH